MRIFTKVIPLLVIGFLLAGFSVPARAQFNPMGDIKLPEVKPPDWSVGQSATYNIKLDGIPDLKALSADLRIAVVGQEAVEGKPFYWIEYDIMNLVGLPQEAAMFKSVRAKILCADIPPEKYNDDPKAVLKDLAEGKIIRKIVFQLNDDVPQMIDIMMIQGLAQMMTGQSLEEMMNQIPEGAAEEATDKVKIETGKENVTVQAGTFANAEFVKFSFAEEGTAGTGTVWAHGKVPVSALVKMAFTVKEESENMNMNINMELKSYESSGAASMIKGTPVPFDFQKLMGGMGGQD